MLVSSEQLNPKTWMSRKKNELKTKDFRQLPGKSILSLALF
ncbi:hypothetical protein KIS1582_1012 [Cytobacillus firmus]|uniref:Uncharacterized protein n=1 Tax=Cytobacillus firmus TaxID=1399 RepID=A0A800NE70_CYTFI|nr:hypothetical protein KIS1582_1012 [Cytobacillus firmus]